MYAEVLFDLSLDKGFDYLVPAALESKVRPGVRVIAPLRHSERVGYVLRLKETTEYSVRPLVGVDSEEEQIPAPLLRLGEWICDYYCAPKEHSLRMLLPAVVRSGEMKHKQAIFLGLTPKSSANLQDASLTSRQKELLETLQQQGMVLQADFLEQMQTTSQTLQHLEDGGWIVREKRVVDRDPFQDNIVLPDEPKTLTRCQSDALGKIVASVEKRDGAVFLLHGVTGSGKTEVYLQAIQRCLELKREAIVLVPEISLTPQTCDRFRRRFGNQVSVLHSALGDGERFDEWTRIREGRSKIAVGARSALFAPFRNLGLIVVDEEHENTYKQDESPRYNARDVAVVRGKFEKATVVLGSATPSLESYYNTEIGKYTLLEMPERIDGCHLPTVELVDMSVEASSTGQSQMFSRRLKELINDRLEKAEQVILFLNRRGYATQMICPQCGYVSVCSNCSIAHTFHRKENLLMCHLCGEQKIAPETCPQCGAEGIKYTGIGTEKIENVTSALFPHARVERMDADTMTKKDSYRKILTEFRAGRINILIGTQMIAKGLDFPNVTLVGVMQADSTLMLPDFRAGERTFQLITQVAGRAGRGERPGRVVVQTYKPMNFVLQTAREQDYKAFYGEEMPSRKMLDFPPASHIAAVHFRSSDEDAARKAAEEFAAKVIPQMPSGVQVIGPQPSPLSRIKQMFRFQLLLRGGDVRKVTRILRTNVIGAPPVKNVDVYVDVDPRSLM